MYKLRQDLQFHLKMTETSQIILLFFSLPGFFTFLIIRRMGLFGGKVSQIEFLFYSLACSTLSYFLATRLLTTGIIEQLLSQFVIAIILGVVVGFSIKMLFRRRVLRYSPWHTFCHAHLGKYVITYTKSGQRICGWLKMASTDTEPKREVVLGDPERITNKKRIPLGKSMLITENEILRILPIEFDEFEKLDAL